jgi:hypothetical protein
MDGSFPKIEFPLFILAEAGGNWMVSVTLGSGMFAGKVQELPVS